MTSPGNICKALKKRCSCQQAHFLCFLIPGRLSSLEAFHYMLPEGAAAHLGSLEACEAHADKGLLTVIYADTEEGLQVGKSSDVRNVVYVLVNCM